MALADRKIVCLCGSTRFFKEFTEVNLAETLAGNIVLTIGAAVASDDKHFGHLSAAEREATKVRLDALHFDKIELAHEVIVINKDGYVGESTSNEIRHAQKLGRPIRWYDPTQIPVVNSVYLGPPGATKGHDGS